MKNILKFSNKIPRYETLSYSIICSALSHISKQKINHKHIEKYKHLVQKLKFKTKRHNKNDLKLFEIANKISVNIFETTSHNFKCIYQSRQKYEFEAYVLYIKKTRMYYPICNIEKWLFSFKRSNSIRSGNVCKKCFKNFRKKNPTSTYEKHIQTCDFPQQSNITVTESPERIKFKNFQSLVLKPFVIYADFECLLEKTNLTKGKTQIFQKHIPVTFAAIRICNVNSKFSSDIFTFHGENAIEQFSKFLDEQEKYIYNILNTTNYKIDMTSYDNEKFNNAKICYVCKNTFSINFPKLRDHDHIKKKRNYRGAICNSCNLNRTNIDFKTPVIFHAGTNYDFNCIIENFNQNETFSNVIAKTSEKIISFKNRSFIFLDSFNFLNDSLDTLSSRLFNDDFKYLNKFLSSMYPHISKDIIRKKQIYPYSYFDSLEKYNTKEFPDISYFYNDLKKKDLSLSDYEQGKTLYKNLNCKSILDYHLLYVKMDVLLLTDVFEKFRNTSFKLSKVDPVWFLTLPGLAWNSFLYQNDFPLVTIHELEIYNFFKKSIRGGVSQVSYRMATANHLDLPHNLFDAKKPYAFIQYLDVINLYGSCMLEYLPMNDFEWVDFNDFNSAYKMIMSTSSDSEIGYYCEIDMIYPPDIQDFWIDLPPGVNHVELNDDFLSPYSKQDKTAKNTYKKLVGTFLPKKHYVTYYKNFQFYDRIGIKITKIHKILKFKQAPYLKKYVLDSIEQRKNSSHEFDRNYHKMRINVLYGKSIQNVLTNNRTYLVKNIDQYLKLINSPYFIGQKSINDQLCCINLKQENILLNNPIYLGATILELSKLKMLEYYSLFKTQFGSNIRLMYQDTDSFIFLYKNIKNVYLELLNNKTIYNILDTSNYPENHILYNKQNKSIPGFLKDEVPPDNFILEYIGLKSKNYSLKLLNNEEILKAKGGSVDQLKENISHETYKDVLINEKKVISNFNKIKSYDHKLYTEKILKKVLDFNDDKRYILDNSIDTLPFGHYKISKHKSKTFEKLHLKCHIVFMNYNNIIVFISKSNPFFVSDIEKHILEKDYILSILYCIGDISKWDSETTLNILINKKHYITLFRSDIELLFQVTTKMSQENTNMSNKKYAYLDFIVDKLNVNIISTKSKNKIIIPNEDFKKIYENTNNEINTECIYTKFNMKTENVTVYSKITTKSLVLSSENIHEIHEIFLRGEHLNLEKKISLVMPKKNSSTKDNTNEKIISLNILKSKKNDAMFYQFINDKSSIILSQKAIENFFYNQNITRSGTYIDSNQRTWKTEVIINQKKQKNISNSKKAIYFHLKDFLEGLPVISMTDVLRNSFKQYLQNISLLSESEESQNSSSGSDNDSSDYETECFKNKNVQTIDIKNKNVQTIDSNQTNNFENSTSEKTSVVENDDNSNCDEIIDDNSNCDEIIDVNETKQTDYQNITDIELDNHTSTHKRSVDNTKEEILDIKKLKK